MGIPLNIAPEDQLIPLNVDRQGLRRAADYEVENSSQFNRGWQSAGASEDAGSLLWKANRAYAAGDDLGGAAYEQQGRDAMSRAQMWAPTVQNLTDVDGLRSAIDWVGGAAGNIRSSVKPALGAVAGTGLGLLASRFTGGRVNPANIGQLGSFLGGYDMMTEGENASAMVDPTIRATRSMDEIANASRGSGVVQGALESIVPAKLGTSLLGQGAGVVKGQVAKGIGKRMATDAAEEFATEFLQNPVSDVTQNYLKGEPLGDVDWKAALNAGAAGSIGGLTMGAGGAAMDVAHDKVRGAGEKVGDKVGELKSDPLGSVLDAGTAVVRKAGELSARAENYFDTKDKLAAGMTQDDIDRELLTSMMGERRSSAADPVGVDEGHLSDSELVAKRREQATADGWDGTGSWLDHARKTKQEREAASEAADTDEFLNTIDGGSKKSMMQAVSRADDPARKAAMDEGRAAREAVKAAANKPAGLAEVLVNQGYSEKLISAAKSGTSRDQDIRKVAGILNWGASYNFNRVDEVVPAMVKQFGEKAPKLFRKAYDAGVKEGLFPRNDEHADMIEERLTKEHVSNKMLADVLVANLRPTVRAELDSRGKPGSPGYNKAVAGLLSEVRRVVNMGAKGNNRTQAGNVKSRSTGVRGINDDVVMRILFGTDEKNVSSVVEAFYSPQAASKNGGRQSQEDVKVDKGDEEANIMGIEAGVEESGNEARAVEKRTYHGDFRDVTRADSSAELDKEEADLKANDGSVSRVGMKTALLDQYATKKDTEVEKLDAHERTKALEAAVLKHFPELAHRKPGGIPPTANDVAKKDYKKRVADWQGVVEARANVLERSFATLQTSDVERTDTMPNQFFAIDEKGRVDRSAIRALQLDRSLDHPSNSVENGTLVFKLKTGGDFITSAPLLMRKMFRVKGLLGDDGSYHKDLKGGKIQNSAGILMEGITSMLEDEGYFTGQFGYVRGGKAVWMQGSQQFPKNFRLMGEGPTLITWGDSVDAGKHARANLKSEDYESGGPKTGMVNRDVTSFDKTEALNAALKNDGIKAKIDAEKLAAFIKKYNTAMFTKLKDTEHGKALIKAKEAARAASTNTKAIHKLNAEVAKLKTMTNWAFERDQARAAKKADEPRIKESALDKVVGAQQQRFEEVLDQWVEHVFPNGITVTEQVAGEAERGTAVDGLAAYDTDKDIVRDERGDVETSNLEMAAQSRVGTSKKVAREDAGEFSPATIPFPSLTSTEAQNMAAEKLQAAKDWVAQTSPEGIVEAIAKMDSAQLKVLNAALFGRDARSEREHRVSDTKVENGVHHRVYDKDIGGVRTKGTGEKYLAGFTQVGLIDTNKGVLGTQYFGKSLRKANDFVDMLKANEAKIKSARNARALELKNDNRRVRSNAEEAAGGAGQADTRVGKAGVAVGGGREQSDSESRVGAGEQGRESGSGLKSSKQRTGDLASDADRKAAVDHITKTLGDSVSGSFAKAFADGSSGSWTPGDVKNAIRLALNGDVLQASFHESFHEFMDILRKHGGAKVEAQIMRAATSPMMKAKLDRLLNGHPEAQAQLSDPEEAAAYMYQFWVAGKLNLGPETKSAFQRIVDWFKNVTGMLADEVKRMEMDELQAEKLMRAFSAGAMADTSQRQAVVEAMNHSVEVNEAAQVKVGKAMDAINNTAGKLLFSAEAMVEATGNKYMGDGAALFHQKAGTAMRTQTFMDATRQKTSLYMNKLENTLMGFDKADLELAREGMSTERRPTSKAAGQAYDAMKAYFKEMADYLEEKEVKRLDFINGKPTWVKIDFRKHYWPQVWDMDVMEKNLDGFRADLMEHHGDILAKIAKEANEEVKRRQGAGEGTASSDQIASGEGKEITPAMIADAIVVRMQYTNGQLDIDESLDELGITPMAAAVNRRKLDWLDPEVFDKYKSKDIAKIMTTYTVNMVKRAEYQQRFGPGGEVLRDLSDKAILLEVGGDKLVSYAEGHLDDAVESWNKAAAAWAKNNPNEKYDVTYPTLRTVGLQHHAVEVGKEKAAAASKSALKKLEQGFKAFQAMEGTLGRDISPNFRTFSSWMVTYQNFTKLSTMLFTSFQDVMGIVANGGEMNDAWNAFVSGIKEIKNSWTDKKDGSRMMNRAELWGAVDAGSFADAIGQAYGSSFMTGHARRMSDKFFKWTGAEGWNRGVRAVAAQVAERTILEWKQDGIDLSDPAAKARIERLYGKGATADSIKLDADGQLDISSPANQAAVTRWVLDAVPTTSAAHRPIWGSDPHYQMFIQFKNYTYSFHRILLKGAVEQAKLGNYRPALVLAVGYMPIAIAGGAIKEMLIPGEEPPWMQGGLDDYLSYGFTKAGVLGVPQMYAQNLYDLDPAATFGPSIDQLQNVMSIPIFENRTLLGEGLGALPGGNLLRRAAN